MTSYRGIAKFQSTPSAWRVTEWDARIWRCKRISIHTLRVEGDQGHTLGASTSFIISIHTLRVEGDSGYKEGSNMTQNFNPHPPRGG